MTQEVEVNYCAIHDVAEPTEPQDYLVCFECKHVYKTAKELLEEFLTFLARMYKDYQDVFNKNPNPTPSPISADDVPYCPLCLHDF